jgi:RNA polymerase sigma-70 factor (ECF subfamily)
VARYLPLLQRWAHGRLPANARGLLETGDLVQVALIRSLDHLDSFQSQREGAFLAYLRRALMNQLRNEIKRSGRHPTGEITDEEADRRESLLEQLIDRTVIDEYETALETLPETTQEAIIMSLEFGMSHREIAEAIGSPSANAARMTVSRGLLKLARAMSEGQ